MGGEDVFWSADVLEHIGIDEAIELSIRDRLCGRGVVADEYLDSTSLSHTCGRLERFNSKHMSAALHKFGLGESTATPEAEDDAGGLGDVSQHIGAEMTEVFC